MAVDSGHGEFRKAHLVGWIPEVTNDAPRFDPLTTSASALLDMLTEGNITSVQILYEYYRQILKYNGYLKAVYRLMPSALDRAKQLDAQRASGGPIGSLHGIPILLKVGPAIVSPSTPRTEYQRLNNLAIRIMSVPSQGWKWTIPVAT